MHFTSVLLLLCNLINIRLVSFLGISIDATVFRGCIIVEPVAASTSGTDTHLPGGRSIRQEERRKCRRCGRLTDQQLDLSEEVSSRRTRPARRPEDGIESSRGETAGYERRTTNTTDLSRKPGLPRLSSGPATLNKLAEHDRAIPNTTENTSGPLRHPHALVIFSKRSAANLVKN